MKHPAFCLSLRGGGALVTKPYPLLETFVTSHQALLSFGFPSKNTAVGVYVLSVLSTYDKI